MSSILRKMTLQIAAIGLIFVILAIVCMEFPILSFVVLMVGLSLTFILSSSLALQVFVLKRRLRRYDVDLSLDMDNVVYKKGDIVITEDFLIQYYFVFFSACFREEVDHAHYVKENRLILVKENGERMLLRINDDETRKEVNYFLGAVLQGVRNDCDSMWLEIPEYYKTATTSAVKTEVKHTGTVNSIQPKIKTPTTNSNLPVTVVIGIFVATFSVLMFITVLSTINIGVAKPEPVYREETLDMLYEKYISMYPYIGEANDSCVFIWEMNEGTELIVSNTCDTIGEVDIDLFNEDDENYYLGTHYLTSLLPYASVYLNLEDLGPVTDYEYASYSAMFEDAPTLPYFINMQLGISYDEDSLFIAVEDLDEEKALVLADYYKTYAILAYKEYSIIYLYDYTSVDDDFIYSYGGYYEPDYMIEIFADEGLMYVYEANGLSHHSIWLD